MMFRQIVLSSLVIGLVSGVVYGLFQQSEITPLIHAAEQYETVGSTVYSPSDSGLDQVHNHRSDLSTTNLQRVLWSMCANVLIAMAFSLFVVSFMTLHNLKSTRQPITLIAGFGWGIAMTITLFVAPAVAGLHAEIPGTRSGALPDRQALWLFCVTFTAAGLGILYYASHSRKLVGLFLLLMPQIYSALSISEESTFSNTDSAAIANLIELSEQFLLMTAAGMLVFCLLLCALCSYAVRQFTN